MKLTRQEQDIVRRKFCCYCIKVLNGEAMNYLKELNKLREREVNFSELLQNEWNQLCIHDEMLEINCFQVMNMDVSVKDDDISEALKCLPEKKRMIILMAYFLDMTEQEIAEYRSLSQSRFSAIIKRIDGVNYICSRKNIKSRLNFPLSSRQ